MNFLIYGFVWLFTAEALGIEGDIAGVPTLMEPTF